MRSTSSFIRVAAHALLLALAAFLLVTIGCTGANATPAAQDSPGTQGASAMSQPLAATTPAAVQQSADLAATHITGQQATGLETARQALTACVPGRDKARVESNAVAPTPAHLQDSPGNANSSLPDRARANTVSAQLSDRIPAALTHLDLGIVRT